MVDRELLKMIKEQNDLLKMILKELQNNSEFENEIMKYLRKNE